jgi:pSer/pThr/pTyr-binding forkhead associated (FHA) protein
MLDNVIINERFIISLQLGAHMTTDQAQHADEVLKLIIEDDEGSQAHYPILHDELRIGRSHDNQICLTQKNVSRFHASLLLQSTRVSLLVKDLDSYTGIRLNGQRIVNQCTFRMGDLIEIGDYSITLENNQSNSAQKSSKPIKSNAEPLADEYRATLVVVSNNLAGQIYQLNQKEMIIGRESSENDLVVNHRSISRNHAKIIWRNGDFTIIDLRSANGISINGSDFGTATLVNGDIIKMGHVKLRYVAPGDHYVFNIADTDNVVLDHSFSWLHSIFKPLIIFITVLSLAFLASKWWHGHFNSVESDFSDPSIIDIEVPSTAIDPLPTATDMMKPKSPQPIEFEESELNDGANTHEENTHEVNIHEVNIHEVKPNGDQSTQDNPQEASVDQPQQEIELDETDLRDDDSKVDQIKDVKVDLSKKVKSNVDSKPKDKKSSRSNAKKSNQEDRSQKTKEAPKIKQKTDHSTK